MARTKVFVGNLSFKTREPSLQTAFETAGKVVSATIVSRGRRSLGYGFVEFENEEAAKKAVETLNKQPLDEREINVELAKPREENPNQGQGGQGQGQPRGQGGFRGGNYRGGRGFGRGRGGFRPRGPRGGFGGQGGYSRGGQGGFRPRRGRGGFGGQRPPKKPLEERNLQPSETTLFVTNLPFKLNDEEFGKIFAEAGVKAKSAKVVVRFNGRSRGYGFVEFDNHADQQKALNAVDKKTVEGRELIVKVAMVDPNAPAQGQQPANNATQGQTPKPAQPAQPAQQATPKAAQPAQPAQQPAKTAQPAQPAQQATPAKPAQPAPAPAQQATPAKPAPAQQTTPAPAQQAPAKQSPQGAPKQEQQKANNNKKEATKK